MFPAKKAGVLIALNLQKFNVPDFGFAQFPSSNPPMTKLLLFLGKIYISINENIFQYRSLFYAYETSI